MEQYKKDEWSHEAQKLYKDYQKTNIKEMIAKREQDKNTFFYAKKAQESILWLIDHDIVSNHMTINDVINILEETLKKIGDKIRQENNEME